MSRPSRPAATLFLVLFAAQCGMVALTPIVPDVAAAFGTSTAAVGGVRLGSALAGAAVALGLALLLPTARAGRLLAAGLALVAAGSLASAAAPVFAIVSGAQAGVGAGIALCVTGTTVAAGDWSPAGQRSAVLAWALSGPPTAWILGMPVFGALADVDWRLAWAIPPTLAAAAALVALRGIGATARRSAPDGSAPAQPSRFDSAVARYALTETLTYGAWGGILIFADALLRESYGISPTTAGLLLGGAAIAYLPGTALAGRWAAASTRPWMASSTLCAAGLVGLFGALRPGAAPSIVLFAALTFVAAARMFAGGAQAVHAAPHRRVMMASARGTASQLGYVLGAAVGMAVLPLGGYTALGLTLAAMFVLAAALGAAQPLRAAR